MSETTQIKLIKELDVTDLSGEKVMVDFESGNYFLLKGVANDIWEYIQSPITIGEIKDKLLSEYEVDETTCLREVQKFIRQLFEYKFVELSE